MSDRVIILNLTAGKKIAKAFRGADYQVVQFNPGSEFLVAQTTINNLESLASVINALETEPSKAIIPGSMIEDQTNPVSRNRETFTATPRQWCMINIDSLALDGDISDQQAMLSHAIQQLPLEFRSVDCCYHFSSSMGIKGGIRVYLWYWLERPCSDNEMKAWLSGCPVDMRLFNPIQIHLTANPRFINGAVDPYHNRSGLFGSGDGLSTVSPEYINDIPCRILCAAGSHKVAAMKAVLLRDVATVLVINDKTARALLK